MQKDMDDAIEHLKMQLEDLRSKFGSVPLLLASGLPFDGNSMHGDSVLSLATPPQKAKSESPEVCQHHGAVYLQTPWCILLLLQYCLQLHQVRYLLWDNLEDLRHLALLCHPLHPIYLIFKVYLPLGPSLTSLL